MKRMTNWLWMVLAVTLVMAACTAPAAPATGGNSDAGAANGEATGRTVARDELLVGVQGLPGGMDPAAELSNVGTRVTYNVYDTLIRRNFLKDNVLEPALATSWERIDDLTLELKLREGVTFHNGEPFGADDVQFTFDRFKNPDSAAASAKGYFSTFDTIEVVDDLTVRIHTLAPDPLIENRLASWASWIVPKDFIEANGE